MGRSSYPGQIDSDVELPRVEDNVSEIGGDAINSLRDAIFSIETTLGIDPQGNTDDLAARINVTLDADGRIKQAALAERGLVTLPITNAHISSGAAIEELKLDLEYGTAYLNGRIVSNTTDIDALRTTFNILSAQLTQHFGGSGFRHQGNDIDLATAIRTYDTVEDALSALNTAFTNHEASIGGAHTAAGISAVDVFSNFSADEVQTALEELDRLTSSVIQEHQDKGHRTGVVLNQRGEQGIQGNLRETTFAGTIYQTEQSKATNIFQVMRPDVARITSKEIDLNALEVGTRHVLRIQAGGVGLSPLDVNFTAIIPTEDLDEVVAAINTKAQGCDDHYPISAYNTGGRLTIAHNIPGAEFTITILDTVQFTAHSALGFGDVAGTEISWPGDSNAAYIGGVNITGMRSLIKRRHTHSTKPLNTIVLGLGDLSQYGLTIGNEGRILCNIYNHSTNSESNGTHYILGFPNNETFVLSSDISLGDFDIEIPADAVNFENSANGEIYDIFVEAYSDGYGMVTKSPRASYHPIAGVDIKAISEDFPTSDVEWAILDASQIQLYEHGESGMPVTIPTGFQGQLKAYAPDNVNSALFEVTGIPSSSREDITVHSFGGTDDRLHVASVHYSGNYNLYTLKHVMDKRPLGVSPENKSEDALAPLAVEDATGELRNNGVIRGFDVISWGSTSFKVRGGRAIVDGRIVEVDTRDVTVDDVSASKKTLLLDRDGNYIIKGEFESGYSIADLTSGENYGDERNVAIICEFETDGSAIDGYFTDRRLMVNKLDKRIANLEEDLEEQITEIRNTVAGSSWGFTVADASAGDGYLGGIETVAQLGVAYMPGTEYPNLPAHGFAAGSALVTTRRYELTDPEVTARSIFRSIGMTHLNVYMAITYSGITDGENGPFGVSGTVYVQVGVAATRGLEDEVTSEGYATVKTIYTGVLPSKSLTERYVASIPISELDLPENVMFDVVPRVRIINSNYVDGGPGDDPEPTMLLDDVRVVTSSYSIAGAINSEDGSSEALAATVGDIF